MQAASPEHIYDDILYVEEDAEQSVELSQEARCRVKEGKDGEDSEDGSSDGYLEEEEEEGEEENDLRGTFEDNFDAFVDDWGEEDEFTCAWDRSRSNEASEARGNEAAELRQLSLEVSNTGVKLDGNTTLDTLAVTAGRRRSTLYHTFTQSLLMEAKLHQQQRDNFQRGRLRHAVYVLQRGFSLKKKVEHEKSYKERFLFLSDDLRSLRLAKSGQTRHKAKHIAQLRDGLQMVRAGPTLRHRRDAEQLNFHSTTFTLHVRKGKEGSFSHLGHGGLTGTTPPGPEKVIDIWCSSESHCEEWLKCLPLVVNATVCPEHGPRELIWSEPVGQGAGMEAGGWVEGPRPYLEGLAEELARSSIVYYMDVQQRRLRRRTLRQSAQGRDIGAAVAAAMAVHGEDKSKTPHQRSTDNSSGSQASSNTTAGKGEGQGNHNGSHLQNAMKRMHIEHFLSKAREGHGGGSPSGPGLEPVHPATTAASAAASAAVLLLRPRSLNELLSFHASPTKRPFHAYLREEGAAAALKAFRLIMVYMGDLDAVVQEEEQEPGEEGHLWKSPRPHRPAGGSCTSQNNGSDRLRHHSFSSTASISWPFPGGQTQAPRPFSSPSPSESPQSSFSCSSPASKAGEADGEAQHALLLHLCALGQAPSREPGACLKPHAWMHDLRNELYVAALAQTIQNPDPASCLRGWRLLVAFAHSFMPTDDDLRECLIWHADRACHQYAAPPPLPPASGGGRGSEGGRESKEMRTGGRGLDASGLAYHAYTVFVNTERDLQQPPGRDCASGREGRAAPVGLTVAELDRIQALVIPPTVFDCSLEEVLRKELVVVREGGGGGGGDLPSSEMLLENGNVPLIVQVLIRKFQELEGYEVEGIFRRAAVTERVLAVKQGLEDGSYVVYGTEAVDTTDPMVVADLLKAWLRHLREPLVPLQHYRRALDAGQAQDLAPTLAFLDTVLPKANAATLVYLIHFLNHCAELSQFNQMTPRNLAIVFSPNLLRHPSNDPMLMVQNAENERKFVIQLMRALVSPAEPSPTTASPSVPPLVSSR